MKWLFVMCVVVLLASSCGFDQGESSADEYFRGTDSIDLRFMPGTPPDKAYYFTTTYHEEDNHIPITVELTNKGSAETYGGLYISGYDPGFIEVAGVDVDGTGTGIWDCDVDVYHEEKGKNWLMGGSCSFFNNALNIYGAGDPGDINKFSGGLSGDVAGVIGIFDDDAGEWMERNIGDLDISYDYDPDTERWGFDWQKMAGDKTLSLSRYDAGTGALWFFTTSYASMDGPNMIDKTHGREFMLMGDKSTYPGGESEFITFDAEIQNWPRAMETTEAVFLLTSCFTYGTHANPQVCVDPFPDSGDNKVCRPRTITYSSGQGAPIAITRIEQENTPRSIIFTIHVENKGGGIVYKPMSLHKCDPLKADRVTVRDLNEVFLGDIRMGGNYEQLLCQPQNRMIRLDEEGKGTIVCEYPIEYTMKSAYLSPLTINLWYGYSKTWTKKVQIKRGN